MGSILLLACAAAVYPQLLAVVLVILALPSPRLVLWVCCLTSLVVNVAVGVSIFAVFRSRGTIAGTGESRLGPSAYIALGLVALMLAGLVSTEVGRRWFHGRPRLPGRGRRDQAASSTPRPSLSSRAHDALGRGSLIFAAVTGALLAMPGPFDLLAVGRLARDGDRFTAALWAIVAFAVVKFALIEVPSVAYALDPDRTAAQVRRLSAWLHSNRLLAVAAVIGLLGLVLVARGIAGVIGAR